MGRIPKRKPAPRRIKKVVKKAIRKPRKIVKKAKKAIKKAYKAFRAAPATRLTNSAAPATRLTNIPAPATWLTNININGRNLGKCEGDCDNNSDCNEGLKCAQRSGYS